MKNDERLDPEVGAVVRLYGKPVEVTGRPGGAVAFRGNLHGTPQDMPYLWTIEYWRKVVRATELEPWEEG